MVAQVNRRALTNEQARMPVRQRAPQSVLTIKFELTTSGRRPVSSGLEVRFATDEPRADVLAAINHAFTEFRSEAANAVAMILAEDG